MSHLSDGLQRALAEQDTAAILAHAPEAVLKLQQVGDGEPLTDEERAAAQQFLALLNTAFVMAAADHKLEPAEQEYLAVLFYDLSRAQIPREVMEEFFDLWAVGLVNEGFEPTLRRLAGEVGDEKFRRMAYLAAVGVAYADGVMHTSEADLLAVVADAMGISPAEAVRLREGVHAQIEAQSS